MGECKECGEKKVIHEGRCHPCAHAYEIEKSRSLKRTLSFSNCKSCNVLGLDFYQPENICVMCFVKRLEKALAVANESINHCHSILYRNYNESFVTGKFEVNLLKDAQTKIKQILRGDCE